MWSPTHIQVTVQRAKGLLTKGKNGTNNCFVTIGLGKEKYQTSVKEKAESSVNWNEECELKIPDQGNRAELMLTCLHRNNLAIDEFLGQVTLPLNEMDVYDRPRSKWFKLESKPGKEKKNKERGELEVRILFVVKSGSLTDLSKKDKHKSSIGQLASSVGGSLLSIGTIEKRKGIKKFAKSLGSKMHLHSKKKNKDGDDASINGSFASIGTPNSSNGGTRRYGQRAGEADPGVISEDEDEFVFDNLSHKSSGSSLNIRAGLQPASQNFVPHNPSPLLGLNGKAGGKQLQKRNVVEEDLAVDPELEEIAHDFSVRARTLPPPSKPPRTPQMSKDSVTSTPTAADREQKLDEWESKLYGKQLDIGSSDSLKRRSWELARVPLATATEEEPPHQQEEPVGTPKSPPVVETKPSATAASDSSSSSSEEESEEEQVPEPKRVESQVAAKPDTVDVKATPPRDDRKPDDSPKVTPHINILSPDTDAENRNFDQFNASFAKFEQRNSAKIFDLDADPKWDSQAFIAQESQAPQPMALPRKREDREVERQKLQEAEEKQRAQEEEERQAAAATAAASAAATAAAAAEVERKLREEQQRRAAEDARLEVELRLNEERLRKEELALAAELRARKDNELKRREAKRLEEDQRILNFAKRSPSLEEESAGEHATSPEQSPKDLVAERREKRLGKYKFMREKTEAESPPPKSNERIIIGHEKASSHAERRSEITAALAKKYDGKSREELMLIANGMENEALVQRQRVKELEDYLDNLLLRVMETHPKILQNPYSRTTSAKSFKNYINMNDFL